MIVHGCGRRYGTEVRVPRFDRERRRLQHQVRTTLRSLDVGSPLRMATLCEKFGEWRGRPVVLLEQQLSVPGPFGMWVATKDSDTIIYQARTTWAHQRLIILHEFGHIMAGHTSERTEPSSDSMDEPDDEVLQALMPNLPLEMIKSALRRESYGEEQEREAELVGSIILNWGSRIDHVAPPSASSSVGRRLQDGLGDHLGWR